MLRESPGCGLGPSYRRDDENALQFGGASRIAGAARPLVIAAISFLTLVDLFATQAILPSLAKAYGVSPGVIGSAVNACTLGMAAAGLVVAWLNRRIERRLGIVMSLALLSIPTALLAAMPDLVTFAALRIVQGLFMSAAFSLTIAYLAENASVQEAAGALAAYVTGNVASNLVGRFVSAGIADHLGLPANFIFFAALNLAGATIAFVALRQSSPARGAGNDMSDWLSVFSKPELRAGFAIGFIILFVFIGTFTYVNFVLTAPPIGLDAMELGLVYFVFLPAILLTPFAGTTAHRIGARAALTLALAAGMLGLPLLAANNLPIVLGGLVLVGTGTFLAQAVATGFVSRAAGAAHGAGGAIYLTFYYAGGLAGTIVLGQIFSKCGWLWTVVALAVALACGLLIAFFIREPNR